MESISARKCSFGKIEMFCQNMLILRKCSNKGDHLNWILSFMSYFVLPFLLAHATHFIWSSTIFHSSIPYFFNIFLAQFFSTIQRKYFVVLNQTFSISFLQQVFKIYIYCEGGKLKYWHLLWTRNSSISKSFNKYLQLFVKLLGMLSNLKNLRAVANGNLEQFTAVENALHLQVVFHRVNSFIPTSLQVMLVCLPAYGFLTVNSFVVFVHLPYKTIPKYSRSSFFSKSLTTDANLPLRILI